MAERKKTESNVEIIQDKTNLDHIEFNNVEECLSFLQSSLMVGKNSENSFANYKYRNIGAINDALKPLIKATNAVVLNHVRWEEMAGVIVCVGIAEVRYKGDLIKVDHMVFHAPQRPKMDPSQNAGATSTYAMRYALQDLFLLGDDTSDPDKINDGKTDYEPTNITVTPVIVNWEGTPYNYSNNSERDVLRAIVKDAIFKNSIERNREIYQNLKSENSPLLNKELLDWMKQAAQETTSNN